MCYFPIKILNKRFIPTRKNGYNPPECPDERLRYITAECGHCFECRKKKRNMWRIRMKEQKKDTPTGVFFTGTIKPERYKKIKNKYNIKNDNDIATKAVRLFLERIRKETGKSIKHWIVTEKGHTNTRRIHIHGLFFDTIGIGKYNLERLLKRNWIDGYSYNGYSTSEKCINYISKYMTKKDEVNPEFIGKVLASPGLGAGYTERNKRYHTFHGENTHEEYINYNGVAETLPRYYKEKLWTEEQRQELWIIKENKGIKWIGKQKFNTLSEEGRQWYENVLEEHNKTGAATHKDDIEEILIKKLLNQREKRKERAKKYLKVYGHFLRQRINSDKKFTKDIEQFQRFMESEEYTYLRV